ncbi:POU domain, class 6, transcription factor 1-like isoform X2 [Acanthaster planci]|uniref:POU domain protein n=1 Tax=Acanthaster planci TaxID=133434 RepID=A0A8B7YET6_ACAPL|nr:POU domain, class 6, transcription factor 1-like isoform X2 [Acanthaster planci]
MIMDGESANQHIVGNGKLDPAVTISGALPSVSVANVITGTQDPMVSGQMTLKTTSNAKPQSASDQLLLAMQSATGGQAIRSGMVISPTKQAFQSGLKGLGTTIPASLGNSTSTQQLLLSPPIQTLQSPQQVLTNQLSAAQQIFTIPSNNATGQQQVLTLPITNAAGQQQILTIPVSLAQTSGGIQFLIPTSGGQLLAANIGGVVPTMANASTGAASQTNVTSALAGLTQTTSVTSLSKQYTSSSSTSAAAAAQPATTTAATTPLPSMSVLASQTGLGQLPLPQMLMNATGLNSSARALAAAGLATMVSAPPLTQVGQLGATNQQTTATPVLTTTQRAAVPAAAASTTAATTDPAAAGLTSQQIAAHGLASTGQLLASHGLPKQLITTQSPVIVGAGQATGAQAAGVQQLIGGQVVTQAVVGSTLVTTQANNQVTAAQVKAPSSPTNNTATVTGSSSGKVSSLGNTTEVDGINLEEIKEFAKAFKIRRLSLGLTQTQVGQALSATEGPAYSQSAICRFEKLDITPKSAQKIKPVLERWMQEAEERHKNGLSQLSDYIGSSEPTKKRKRRTSFTPQALEYLTLQFEKNTHPSGAEMTAMANEINYEREVIRVWFCNKRQALKNTIKKLKAVNDAGSPQETDPSETVVIKTEETYA